MIFLRSHFSAFTIEGLKVKGAKVLGTQMIEGNEVAYQVRIDGEVRILTYLQVREYAAKRVDSRVEL